MGDQSTEWSRSENDYRYSVFMGKENYEMTKEHDIDIISKLNIEITQS